MQSKRDLFGVTYSTAYLDSIARISDRHIKSFDETRAFVMWVVKHKGDLTGLCKGFSPLSLFCLSIRSLTTHVETRPNMHLVSGLNLDKKWGPNPISSPSLW